MARPKSEAKRAAILEAATHIFADRSLGAAPTAEISKAAGIAEGTLFTYFATKDDLINALYRAIKLELAEAMMTGFAASRPVKDRLRHIWDRYLEWGHANPEKCKVLTQLDNSERLTQETRAFGMAPFAPVEAMAKEAIKAGMIRDIPLDFLAAAMGALAKSTLDFMSFYPASTDRYRKLGFEMLWRAIAK